MIEIFLRIYEIILRHFHIFSFLLKKVGSMPTYRKKFFKIFFRVIVLNIAIVDDDFNDLSTAELFLQNFIQKNYPNKKNSINIQTFSRAVDLLLDFKVKKFDLILLDIKMQEVSGIQAAKIIRNQDDDVKIIFLTNSNDFLLEGYRVFASGYILKPLNENIDDFNKTFSYIFSKIFVDNKEIILRVDRVEISVPYKNIFYADIDENHRLCVHLEERKIVTTMTYLEFLAILSEDNRFLECYHRIVINMDFVKSMAKDDFILKNGEIIPISQRKKKEVKAKYMQYLAHK